MYSRLPQVGMAFIQELRLLSSNGVIIAVVSFGVVQKAGEVRVWKSHFCSPKNNDLEVKHINSTHTLFILSLVRIWFYGHTYPSGELNENGFNVFGGYFPHTKRMLPSLFTRTIALFSSSHSGVLEFLSLNKLQWIPMLPASKY